MSRYDEPTAPPTDPPTPDEEPEVLHEWVAEKAGQRFAVIKLSNEGWRT